ncbi:hydroxyquinol 1,2-dioxygenase [Desertibaculum subflavum]|uniref:hydroxyquinol 1,2-dioxygenase n=1 Tax=Desertibaculum subflavum TaxID=2268458 RepID=UPI000E66AAB4
MSDVKTVFGSLASFQKGGIQVIADDPKNYVFSNVFDVASKAKPYERVAVGKNFEYVIECLRTEGTSPWYTADHDEFALVMDGMVEVELQKLGPSQAAAGGKDGAILVKGDPGGPRMGRIVCHRGHMALLPKGNAYRFKSARPGVVIIQTVQGELTIQRWAEICETRSAPV